MNHVPQAASRADFFSSLLELESSQKLANLDPETKALFSDLLKELSADARGRAEQSWRKSKAPMAAYRKAVSVYVYAKPCSLAVRQKPADQGDTSTQTEKQRIQS